MSDPAFCDSCGGPLARWSNQDRPERDKFDIHTGERKRSGNRLTCAKMLAAKGWIEGHSDWSEGESGEWIRGSGNIDGEFPNALDRLFTKLWGG